MSFEKWNVAHHLDRMRDSHPDAPALILDRRGSTQTLNFSELHARVAHTQRSFATKGITRDMRTLLLVKPGGELIISVFALFRMGAVPVVIDPGMGIKHFLQCVRHTRPEALVGIPRAHLLSHLFRNDFQTVKVRCGVRICNSTPNNPKTDQNPCVQSGKDDLAAILFTSGSTGPAKGVCYEHGMFSAQLQAVQQQYQIQPGEIDLPLLPVFALFNPALGMATVVPQMNPSRPASVDPTRLIHSIKSHEVTNSFGSPAIWTKVVRHCQQHKITCPSLKRILMAGAPVSPSLVSQAQNVFPNATIHTPYGATESLPLCSISASEILQNAELTNSGAGTCVGRPVACAEVRVIKPAETAIETLTDDMHCAAGERGEIIARAPYVTRAYDGREEATRNAKITREKDADGSIRETLWHRLGDMGYFDQDGALWFCGRKIERVRTTEGWMFTDCCEAVFNSHPQIFRTALISLQREDEASATPAIVVEPYPEHFPKTAAARMQFIQELEALGKQHAHTAKIDQFFFREKMPVDVRHNAKIHRLRLAREYSTQ